MKRITGLILCLVLMITTTIPVQAASPYSDTETTDWFFGSLDVLAKNKIITGYPDGTFRPSDQLNVDQYITILCRLTDNDVGLGDDYWAQKYIDFAKEAGWLDGMSFYRYDLPINRFQASRMTVRAMEFNSDKSPEELVEYTVYVDDYTDIPTLYRTDVLLNYALGLTNGYPDGTFQGSNTLTRAEAAVISHRIFDEDVRKPLLDPEKTKQLLDIFKMDALDSFAELAPEVTMPANMMMFMLPPPMPMMPPPAPVPIGGLPLAPPVAAITENVIADALIEMSDQESDNKMAAGYSYGILNVNLLSEENDSILMYTVSDGSTEIVLDLLSMQDEFGNLRPDASDLILLVCKNIDEENGDAMHTFILQEYNNRELIPETGSFDTFGTTELYLTNLIQDHNVTRATFLILE